MLDAIGLYNLLNMLYISNKQGVKIVSKTVLSHYFISLLNTSKTAVPNWQAASLNLAQGLCWDTRSSAEALSGISVIKIWSFQGSPHPNPLSKAQPGSFPSHCLKILPCGHNYLTEQPCVQVKLKVKGRGSRHWDKSPHAGCVNAWARLQNRSKHKVGR